MKKSELIEAISEETLFSKKDITRVMASFTRIIERTLKKGGKISIANFGSFWTSRRPERVGVNPATKEKITLPAINVPRFKAGKQFKENVKAL